MAPVGSDLQEMGDFNPYHLIFSWVVEMFFFPACVRQFHHILNYLRDGTLPIGMESQILA
jgi:hypothetical protein